MKCKGCGESTGRSDLDRCYKCAGRMHGFRADKMDAIGKNLPLFVTDQQYEGYERDCRLDAIEKRLEALEERAVGVPVIGLYNALARGLTPGGTMPQNAEDPGDISSPARPPTTYTLPAEAVENLKRRVMSVRFTQEIGPLEGLFEMEQALIAALERALDAARPAE